jgi:hypothetical protein
MTDRARLEQRYRRLLKCYPRACRVERQEEMLGVLMACARDGRRWPGRTDSVNLIANALLMRVRFHAPRSIPTVFWAVRLMALGAVLELASLVTVVATRSDLAAAVARHYPAMPVAHVHHLVNAGSSRSRSGRRSPRACGCGCPGRPIAATVGRVAGLARCSRSRQ